MDLNQVVLFAGFDKLASQRGRPLVAGLLLKHEVVLCQCVLDLGEWGLLVHA